MGTAEKLFHLLKSRALVTGASLVSTGSYVSYKDTTRYQQIEQAFMQGNILSPLSDNSYETRYHGRQDVERKLGMALRSEFTNEYYLVSGGVGCGKTRTIVEMVRRAMAEGGKDRLGAPVYVHVAQGKSFPDTLASAINFFFDEHISFKFFVDFVLRIDSFPRRDKHQKLTRVLSALETAAFRYVQKHGKPVVLVIDGISGLSKDIEGGLEKIQEKAKLWADANIVKVIFVCNDEQTTEAMQDHSSNWSRAAPPIYIGDMKEDQTLSYLRHPSVLESDEDNQQYRSRLTEADIGKIYELVGGRVHHLLVFKRDSAMGMPIGTTIAELKNKEREKFIGIAKAPLVNKALNLMKKSVGAGIPLAKLITESSAEDVALLVKHDIVRIERRLMGMVVVFESKLTQNVAMDMD